MYVGCKKHIRPHYFLCFEHHQDLEDGLIDQCPKCGRFKDAQYNLCSPCYYGRPIPHKLPPVDLPQQNKQPKIEHSKAWEKADKGRTHWFVYILKLDGGEFYVGQTGELRERLMEHKDGKEPATRGKKWKLQYFEILTSREAAEHREPELKTILKSNERQIRRMIIQFKDLVDELNYE
jgi:predicted GIY-YIG superfamily endonuclease